MQRRIHFSGTGGGLLVRFLVGMILTGLTLGLFGPWFCLMICRYIVRNTTMDAEAGPVKFEFTGNGAQLFGTFIVGYLLTVLTLGIYGAWFVCKLARFFTDHSKGIAADGTEYSLKFQGLGEELFVTFLLGYVLMLVTFGVYGAWFVCTLRRFFTNNTTILRRGVLIGEFKFVGRGSRLLLTFLAGYLLTILTIGIYAPWFIVKLWKFVARNTEVAVDGRKYIGDFTGTGGELFCTFLVGYLLTILTIGIYGPWFICKMVKFRLESMVIEDKS